MLIPTDYICIFGYDKNTTVSIAYQISVSLKTNQQTE